MTGDPEEPEPELTRPERAAERRRADCEACVANDTGWR